MKKQLIIGLGTGRCGTVSLYRLLDSQKNSDINHESKPLLTWKFSKKAIDSKLKQILKRNRKYVGDVAFYYLPYVEYILNKYSGTKFICLKRPKEEVIGSFVEHTNKLNWNHWINHDGKKWKKTGAWDKCFPKYNIKRKDEAIKKYWKEYYKEVNKLVKKYPKNIKVFETKILNSGQGVASILKFCKIEKTDQRIIHNIKENRSEDISAYPRYLIRKGLRKIFG